MPTDREEHLIIEPTPFERAGPSDNRRRLALRPLPLGIATVFLCLGLAALFVFNARAVRFELTPVEAVIEISNGFHYRLGERVLMLPGDFMLTATAPGYVTLESSFTVGTAADQNLAFELQKLPGILSVTTVPAAEAQVLIDQVLVGTTPLTLDIAPGEHDISIRTDRYLAYDTTLEIQGKRQLQTLEVQLQPAWAELNVTSTPAGATISIDGSELGATPARVEALQGERQLIVSKPGFKRWRTQLSITAGEHLSLPDISLQVSDGMLAVQSQPSGASVTVDDRYQGQTPVSLTLAPDRTYKVRLTKAGFVPLEETVNIGADADLTLNRKLSPLLGVVELQIKPSDATLFIDGKPRPVSTKRLELSASPHAIRVEKPGYATYETQITPQPGLSQQLLITLQTEDQAKIAATPQTITTAIGQTLKLILPDSFSMGASRREPGRRSNEIEKQVELTRAYYLGVHEVTNAEFKLFDRQHDSGVLGRALLSEDDRPVVNVAWEDAVRFCNWLSEKQGLPAAYEQVKGEWQAVTPMTTGYRLPTEAEWVWAGRYAGTTTPSRFPWGDAMPPTRVDANYADASAQNMVSYTIAGYNDHYRGPAPVGSFSANIFGLFDMAGNVSEWMHDYYSVAIPTRTLQDPMGPETGDSHVIKGSNYTHGRFSELRWTYRDYGAQSRTDVGFRIARYAE